MLVNKCFIFLILKKIKNKMEKGRGGYLSKVCCAIARKCYIER
ncbi:hypothetical protein HMPREF0083_03407 [Aneurinibacillus aneurinilyticus ATCC 12856]|uniref:Uncharacterized protein n=1 Tax=Aneurinibacillus aneurinilyticus ATCC 12856 TaxID=649747 RepID=U1X1U5_ANEAE|nr:hypothetical protein HMPREF0083_03407 [Aneurinibacillus aneurinilyticus ATCC 12856]